MKFYFCNGCGKRITEKDVTQGAARDKKLKGVFCTDCAVGITTTENVPLTEAAAKRLLGKATPADGRPAAGAASNFYFCEKCGTRLTEEDIKHGQAMDKKLKGVYCVGCAEGVLTMEFEGLTSEEAQQLVAHDRAAGGRSAGRRSSRARMQPGTPAGRRRSSGRRVPADFGDDADESSRKRMGRPSGSMGLLAAIGAGSIVVVAMVVFFLMGGSDDKKTVGGKKSRKAKVAKDVKVVKDAGDVKEPAPTGKTLKQEAPPPATEPIPPTQSTRVEPPKKNVDPEEEAQAALEELQRRLGELAKDALAEKKALAAAYLVKHGNTICASRVRVMVRNWENPGGSGSQAGPPKKIGAGQVAWNGEDVNKAASWASPKGASVKAVEVEDAGRKRVVHFVSNDAGGHSNFGWVWSGWGRYPSIDISGRDALAFWLKVEADASKINQFFLMLRSGNAQSGALGLRNYCPQPMDGAWHHVVIPLKDVPQGKFNPAKCSEIKFEFRRNQATAVKLWLDDITFANWEEEEKGAAEKDAQPGNTAPRGEPAKSGDPEAEAQAALVELQKRLAQLPEDSFAEKKKLAAEYLQKHGNAICSARVRVMLRNWETQSRKLGDGVVVWDGEEANYGAGWPRGSITPVDTEDAKQKRVVQVTANGAGEIKFGWVWTGWGRKKPPTDISGREVLTFRLKVDTDATKIGRIVLALRSDGRGSTRLVGLKKYCPTPFDGEWHHVVIPLKDITGWGGAGFKPKKCSEIKFEIRRKQATAVKLWLDDITFANWEKEEEGAEKKETKP